MVPDALMFSAGSKKGARLIDRVGSICDIAEAMLGLDRAAGRTAWIHQQPYGRLFVSADPEDTINFPNLHPRSGQPRYVWTMGADGIERGYLKPEARSGA